MSRGVTGDIYQIKNLQELSPINILVILVIACKGGNSKSQKHCQTHLLIRKNICNVIYYPVIILVHVISCAMRKLVFN